MCLRELFREFVAAKRKAQSERERDVCNNWQTAALVGSAFGGKLPKLETLLKQVAPPKKQDARTKQVMVEALAETYKLPIRKITRKKVAS